MLIACLYWTNLFRSSSSTAANSQQKRKEFTPRPPFQPRTGGPHRGGRGGFRGGRGGGGGWYSVKGSQGTASAQSTSVDAPGDIEQPVMPRVMQPRYAEEGSLSFRFFAFGVR